MDLSHMMALWLAGQSPGVAPGGCAVLYAPTPEAGPATPTDAPKPSAGPAYPFASDRMVMPTPPTGAEVPAWSGAGPTAGLGLIGELEYGPDGLAGFVPRLFAAVSVTMRGGGDGDVSCLDAGDVELGSAARNTAEGSGVGTVRTCIHHGASSIGLTDRLAFVDRFDNAGVLGRARVVGFVVRAGHAGGLVQTCEDVAVETFPVMFGKLVDYLRFAVSAQVVGNGYDDLAGALARADRPSHAVVLAGLVPTLPANGPGAPGNAAEAGDICHSVVYDSASLTRGAVEHALRSGDTEALTGEGVSWLRQTVV